MENYELADADKALQEEVQLATMVLLHELNPATPRPNDENSSIGNMLDLDENYFQYNLQDEVVPEIADILNIPSCDAENNSKNTVKKNYYKCEVCTYSSISKFHLRTHMLIHNGEKPHKCGQCEYSTADLCNLKRHDRIHKQEKPFKCLECSYSATENQHLKNHVLARHTNEKRFQCNVCEIKFATIPSLKKHSLKHLGKRETVHSNNELFCSECDYSSTKKEEYSQHLVTYSLGKSFKCATCEYRTSDKIELQTHVASHSKLNCLGCCNYTYKTNLKVHSIYCKNKEILPSDQLSNESYRNNRNINKKFNFYKRRNYGSAYQLKPQQSCKYFFKCELCDFRCSKESFLKQHVNKVH